MLAGILQKMQAADVRPWAVAVSFLFSLIVIAGHPVPNDDAFGYLRAAELFTRDGLDATLSSYGWYGYSVLIAMVDGLLPIDLMQSAHLLNMLFFALLVWTFITLVSAFDDSRETTWFAALVILCFPTINEMRFILIRDFAYWAFALLALLALIRFNRDGRLFHAAGWLLAMTAAIFFRLEGLLILALSPLALLLPGQRPMPQRLRLLAILLLLMLGGALAVITTFLLAGINLIDIFNYAYRWYLPLLAEYSTTIHGAADNSNLSEHISTQLLWFTGKGIAVLWVGYFYAVVAGLVSALGLPACLLLAWCFLRRKLVWGEACKWPWLTTLASALLALLIFVSIMQFMRARYAVMAALLLLVLVPQCLTSLYRQAQASGRQKLFRNLAVFGVFYLLVDSLVSFGYSKQYILDAAAWSRANMPAGSAIQTNNVAVAYYSQLVDDYDMIDPDPLSSLALSTGKDFLVLDLAHDDSLAMAELAGRDDLTPLARFANKRDDAIIVYRVDR